MILQVLSSILLIIAIAILFGLTPERITDDLVNMLKKYHPIWLNTHFNHPKEMTPEAMEALH